MGEYFKMTDLEWLSSDLLSDEKAKEKYNYLKKNYPDAKIVIGESDIPTDNDRSWEHLCIKIMFKSKEDEAFFILKEGLK